ncbi:flagellar biosynthesis protein FlhF [Modicisalibacter muralis]|uniref:Flagellar biosynthesis protein FlhF n=1 Tax=Modicisalibacter muralis TaxID=119000 RepID=A0A1G9G0F1_9GAMM|nr:flagellar biosynthesis protein FlhF [Halomonas muralis]SDK94109.1 flagellar biosynthesis protein FlhF [Halomonas muralis]
MSVKRFVAANSRDAMRQVRAALGEDALILSNRRVTEGVEILALADDDHGRMTERPAGSPGLADAPSPRVPTHRSPPPANRSMPQPAAEPSETPIPTTQGTPLDFAAFSERVLGEMHDLRALLTTQQSLSLSATHGVNSEVERLQHRLLGAGFSPRLAAELLETLPAELGGAEQNGEAGEAWLKRQLAARLPTLDDEAALLDAGGVFALIGPTGIGKTTTTAKLAARYVMRHGGADVALVTTDSYRVGAHEQLRIYARLLGVEVHALEADAPLGDLLDRLAAKRLVIVDTVGMSQRDQRLVGQVAMLGDSTQGDSARPIRRLLLLNAASHGDTLDEVVDTYQRASLAAGAPLYGAILTKVDEAPRLGAVLDIAIRHGLRLHYVSHGQQVPEDLRLAEREPLIEQALAAGGESCFVAESGGLHRSPTGRRLQSLSRGLLGQGRALAAALATLRREVTGFGMLEQAWPLLGYPLEQQRRRLPELLDPTLWRDMDSKEPPQAMLWARSTTVSGADWPMPALCLNAEGRALALPWLAHLQPAGEAERLHWAESQLGMRWQLLPNCPTAAAREYLERGIAVWLAIVQGNSRVIAAGERYTLAALAAHAEPRAQVDCRYRGHDTRLAVSRLAVTRIDGESLNAWFGTLSDADSGRQMAQRYWLAPRHDDRESALIESMVAQLIHDDLPLLTRRAWQRLDETGQQRVDPELRLLVAAGLAAVASRLDQEHAPWAMDVRAQLLGLLGGRRSRSPSVLLEALMHLFTARDAFVQVGGHGIGDEARR